jgi:hypothetical protein
VADLAFAEAFARQLLADAEASDMERRKSWDSLQAKMEQTFHKLQQITDNRLQGGSISINPQALQEQGDGSSTFSPTVTPKT